MIDEHHWNSMVIVIAAVLEIVLLDRNANAFSQQLVK